MSSLVRRIQRRVLRKRSDYEPAPQAVETFKDGSYSTLRPTKGWAHFSARRLAAQRRMAQMLDHFIPERIRKPAKLWRKPAPPAPSTETRQQRRHKQRSA